MPKGRPPSGKPLSRERDQRAKTAAYTTVAETGATYGEPLPNDFDWHPMTLRWWQSWRGTPWAKDWTEVEWAHLLDTAMLHSEMWNGNHRLAGEIRLRVSAYGATASDRERLRIKLAEHLPEATAEPHMDAKRRQRLQLLTKD